MSPAIVGDSATAVSVQTQETIKTRIGDLYFMRDFANGYP